MKHLINRFFIGLSVVTTGVCIFLVVVGAFTVGWYGIKGLVWLWYHTPWLVWVIPAVVGLCYLIGYIIEVHDDFPL